MRLLLLWWLVWQRILQLLLLCDAFFEDVHAQVDAGMVGVGEIGSEGARVSWTWRKFDALVKKKS